MDFAWYHDESDSDLLKNMSNGTEIEKLAVDILKYLGTCERKMIQSEQNKRKTSAVNWYKRLFEGS